MYELLEGIQVMKKDSKPPRTAKEKELRERLDALSKVRQMLQHRHVVALLLPTLSVIFQSI